MHWGSLLNNILKLLQEENRKIADKIIKLKNKHKKATLKIREFVLKIKIKNEDIIYYKNQYDYLDRENKRLESANKRLKESLKKFGAIKNSKNIENDSRFKILEIE